jgi:hypothetical protein
VILIIKIINNNHLVKNVLIDYVIQKKYIKNFVQKYNMLNIDFYVNNVIKIIVIIIFVNYVNKFIRILEMHKMMINGLDVINVIVG